MKRILNPTAFITTVLLLLTMARAEDQPTDAAAAKAAAIRFLVASAVGDSGTLQTLTINVDPDLVQATAGFMASGREVDTAARATFTKPDQAKPDAPKTADELGRALQALDVHVNEDTATVPVASKMVASRTMTLKRIDGQWHVDGSDIYLRLPPERIRLAVRGLQVAAQVNRDFAGELIAGKYADWPTAKTTLAEKTKAAIAADGEHQSLMQAAQVAPKRPAPVAAAPPGPQPPVARPEPPRKPAEGELPAGATRSEMVGGKGGGPFVHVNASAQPVLGFRYSMGHWANREVLRQLDPIYADTAAENDDQAKTIAARPGYVVGGLVVDTDGINAVAVRVIFVLSKDGRVHPAVHYVSDWIGIPSHKSVKTLAGKGEQVLGTFGRKGVNLDAVGLVIGPPGGG